MKTSLVLICLTAALFVTSTNASFVESFLAQSGLKESDLQALGAFDPALIDDYIFGFLKGLKIDTYVTNSTACVQATENMTLDLYYSGHFVLEKGLNIETLLNTTKSMQDVKPFIKICYSVTGTAFNKLIEHFMAFKSLTDFLTRFFMNAIAKTYPLQQIIQQIQTARDEGNYTDVFYQTGRITRILFDIDADRMDGEFSNKHYEMIREGHDDDDKFEQILHFLSAFINATNVLEETHHEQICRESAESLDEMFKDVPKFIEQEDYEQAIYSVADIFGQFYPVTNNCYLTAVEVTKSAEKYRHVFESPWNLMTNIIYNFGGLYDRAVKMTTCFGFYDAECAGTNLGEIVHIIFFNK